MALALFDLDNTLLLGDSDYLWGRFLVEQGIVDGDYYEQENERFYKEYKEGRLDIFEFLRFSLRPLREHAPEQLQAWREEFLTQKIDPIISDAAQALLQRHRKAGDELLIITATNSFVTRPIAERFGVQQLIATEPEQIDGHYTGEVAGEPCFQAGKVRRLQQWMADHQLDLRDSWFYSDSHNDLPLLEQVDHPVAVDPDPSLAETARQRGWPVISLRE
ncbi:histidinol-phosphatase [endosymbiont of Ridgeia piscesae]|jgi:HAD superfamily hydrolase (TIGR01490 family)|uniref:Histidinol-phosphatase n=1 Tax=endosymbiont of Ridgeia piscesae TaxID=54398 RepID=A0A0T5ZAZ6_9GAMM|nr:HAD family hydrolase [endosymbiont of Ridgeia piscesae]KRT54273.1 HAD-superfamily subfamily IB hydrolase, TIGR01490 [endosymbiont of Ridgeia piscesae]KRT59750.1 HAD-superfamily subfamily IB hydrolase, TIGR01490 [endosymbiont of Ridgeia piscesae]